MIKCKEQKSFQIQITEKAVLNTLQEIAYKEVLKTETPEKSPKKVNKDAKSWMCQNYYDIRTFGGVLTTGDYNCGQVRGPVQITFSRSIDQIVPSEHTITRMAVTSEKRSQDQDGANQEFGRKHTVPYGLYLCKGFISANFAKDTGFSKEDLKLFFEALENMFDHDRSASKGQMSTQKLIIFEHSSELGEAPAQKLFEKISIKRKNTELPAREFSDYIISFDGQEIKNNNITLTYSVKSDGNCAFSVQEEKEPIWKA